MNIENIFSGSLQGTQLGDALFGGFMGALVVLGLLFILVFVAVTYIYTSFAWMIIAKKLKHKNPWLAWIPIANNAMILQLGRFHWAWIFLILVPVAGWIALYVLSIITRWRIFEKRKYPGWFSLSIIIPWIGGLLYLIAIGFAAWKDKKK